MNVDNVYTNLHNKLGDRVNLFECTMDCICARLGNAFVKVISRIAYPFAEIVFDAFMLMRI